MSPGATTIGTPFSTTIKRTSQSNCEPSYVRGRWVPDALRTHPESRHPTDSGRWFNSANDASSRRNLAQPLRQLRWLRWLRRLRWPRWPLWLWWPRCWVSRVYEIPQPNDTSTGHVRDEYGEQFGRSAGWVWVNIVSTTSEEFGSILASSGCVRSDFENGSTGGKAKERSTYNMVCIVCEKWAGNGPRILRRCWQTHTKPPGSAAVGPRRCAVYVICDRLERPAVAIVGMNPRSLWTPLLWGRGSFLSCTVCTFTLNLQWRQPHSSTREAAYGDPRCTGMSFLGLAETEERPSEKRLQFELQLLRSVSNFDTNTDTDTYSTKRASATEQPAMSPCGQEGNDDQLPLRLSSGSQHRHGEASPISIPTQTYLAYARTHSMTRASATVQQVMSTCV